MGKGPEKTNVMRVLDAAHVEYTSHEYDKTETEGVKVAALLGQDERCVFKTLVTEAPGGLHFVFVIPVAETLDLKAAARAAGVKSVSMIKQKELLPLTGYIHGGCSPIGMKKPYPTWIDRSAEALDTFCVSAGRVGRQIELSPSSLADFIGAAFADLTV